MSTFNRFVEKLKIVNEAGKKLASGEATLEELPELFEYSALFIDKQGQSAFRSLWNNFPGIFSSHCKAKQKTGFGLPEDQIKIIKRNLIPLIKHNMYEAVHVECLEVDFELAAAN